MIVTRLELQRFRNLGEQVIEPHPRCSVICGHNAQGKTNLLEAIGLVASLRSFRTSRAVEMVRFGEEQARVRARVLSQGVEHELAVELSRSGRRAQVDGKGVRSAAGYLGRLNAVVFTPEELQVPRGAPAERRRLLDRAIVIVWPAYGALLKDYQRALQSRNRLLRQRASVALLEVYEQQLADLGSKLVAGRLRYLKALGEGFEAAFERISRSGVRGALRYLSAREVEAAGDQIKDLRGALAAQLVASRATDLARQTTTAGPQADDLEFNLDGRSTRSCGSQGQVRGLVLAFKIAQILNIHDTLGHDPTLLLDDVSSELDPLRNQYLFEFLGEIESQLFVTTTRVELLPLPSEHIEFKVENGIIVGS